MGDVFNNRRSNVVASIFAGVLVAGLVVLPTSFASASPSSDSAGEKLTVSSSNGAYSTGRWQYGNLSAHARVSGRTVEYSADLSSLQYSWGIAWYGNKKPTKVVFLFRLVSQAPGSDRHGQSEIRIARTSGTATDRVSGVFPFPESASYRLTVEAFAYGGYWGHPDEGRPGYEGKTSNGSGIIYARTAVELNDVVLGE